MFRIKRKWWLPILLLIVCWRVQVFADDSAKVMQSTVENEELIIYVNQSGDVEQTTGQIAMKETEVTGYTTTDDIHTIILFDNSLSVTAENKKKVRAILKEYLQGKPAGERVSVATYGENVEYIIQEETDAEVIGQALDGIQDQNRDSYLTDVIYDEIEQLSASSAYVRFIVVSDGVDNKSIGYTSEELEKLLAVKNYPIYALGCRYQNNETKLENFFAIARLTGAQSFLVDDYTEYAEITQALNEPVYCIRMQIPQECMDGSEKSFKISTTISDRTVQFIGKAVMPFGLEAVQEETSQPQTQTQEEQPQTLEPVVAEETTAVVEEIIVVTEEETGGVDIVSVIAIVVIAAALIALLVMKKKSFGDATKNQKPKKEKKTQKEKKKTKLSLFKEEPAERGPVDSDDSATVLGTMSKEEDEDETVLMMSGQYILVLRDVKNASKVFRYPIIGKVIIGRSANYGAQLIINYAGSVSKTHCEVTEKNGKFYIRDLNSTAGTYLNGIRIREMSEFEPGAHVRMGDLEFIMEIES